MSGEMTVPKPSLAGTTLSPEARPWTFKMVASVYLPLSSFLTLKPMEKQKGLSWGSN
jgi:hypothetical protein